MEYKKHYDQLIKKSVIRNLNKKNTDLYLERHHIIPKCLGGSDNKENLVYLTAKEHFIAHLLLAEIYGGKLVYAILAMSNQSNRFQKRNNRLSSRTYEYYKKTILKDVALRFSNCNKNLPKTEEHKLKISQALKGKSNCHKGKIKSIDHKNKIVESRKLNNKEWLKSETKNKISEKLKNNPKIECPYCKKLGDTSNMKRWHFENCKFKN